MTIEEGLKALDNFILFFGVLFVLSLIMVIYKRFRTCFKWLLLSNFFMIGIFWFFKLLIFTEDIIYFILMIICFAFAILFGIAFLFLFQIEYNIDFSNIKLKDS